MPFFMFRILEYFPHQINLWLGWGGGGGGGGGGGAWPHQPPYSYNYAFYVVNALNTCLQNLQAITLDPS